MSLYGIAAAIIGLVATYLVFAPVLSAFNAVTSILGG
jgi:hypothetical protein